MNKDNGIDKTKNDVKKPNIFIRIFKTMFKISIIISIISILLIVIGIFVLDKKLKKWKQDAVNSGDSTKDFITRPLHLMNSIVCGMSLGTDANACNNLPYPCPDTHPYSYGLTECGKYCATGTYLTADNDCRCIDKNTYWDKNTHTCISGTK